MYTKKDLEVRFNKSDNTIYKTLQVCGLDTSRQEYTAEEIENYFIPARSMLDAGKSYKKVKEYFALKKGGQSGNDEAFEEQEQDFDPSGFTSNQTTDATDTVSLAVAQTVADMVERSVKDIAPFIPALVVQTINLELNSGQTKAAFEQMRTQIKENQGSGAAFFAPEDAAAEPESIDASTTAGVSSIARSLAGELTRLALELLQEQALAQHAVTTTAQTDEPLQSQPNQSNPHNRPKQPNQPNQQYAHNQQTPPQLSSKELYLWRRFAQVIGRSPAHLQAIDRLLRLAQDVRRGENLDVSERSFQVYHLDLDEFTRLALSLMESGSPLNQAHRQLEVLGQKVGSWWRTFTHRLQRFWNRTYQQIKDQYFALKRR